MTQGTRFFDPELVYRVSDGVGANYKADVRDGQLAVRRAVTRVSDETMEHLLAKLRAGELFEDTTPSNDFNELSTVIGRHNIASVTAELAGFVTTAASTEEWLALMSHDQYMRYAYPGYGGDIPQ